MIEVTSMKKSIKLVSLIVSVIFICTMFVGCSRNVTDKECSIDYDGNEYIGTYTGEWEEDMPAGSGEFISDELLYDGNWADGAFSGHGKLKTTDEDNKEFTYTGEFKKGVFNGKGCKEYGDDNEGYTEEGEFKNGEFSPDLIAGLNAMGSKSSCPFTVSEKTATFINENLDVITGTDFDYEDLANVKDVNISFTDYTKQPDNYLNKMVEWHEFEIAQIWVYDFYNTGNQCIETIAMDDSGHVVRMFMIDDGSHGLGNVLDEGHTFTRLVGTPLSSSYYDNVSGGKTNCVIMLLSYFEYH